MNDRKKYEIGQESELVIINGWCLCKPCIMNYDWKETKITLTIRDAQGIEKNVDTYALGGTASSYFQEKTFWAAFSEFKHICLYTNWDQYHQHK